MQPQMMMPNNFNIMNPFMMPPPPMPPGGAYASQYFGMPPMMMNPFLQYPPQMHPPPMTPRVNQLPQPVKLLV